MPAKHWYDPIPGHLGLPILGNTLLFYRDSLGGLIEAYEKYGRVFKTRIFGELMIGLLGAEANRAVLVERARSFSSEGGWELTIGELFKGGVMLKDGADHRRHRSIMQAAFVHAALVGYMAQMEPILRKHLDDWRAQPPPRVYDAVKQLTLEIASRVFLGLELEHEIARVNRGFLDLVKGSVAFVRRPVPWLAYDRALRAREELKLFLGEVIDARRDRPGPDLLGRLMSAESAEGHRLEKVEIIDHMIFLLMAAHDTTTSTLTSLFYELGRHPDWQRRLRERCDAIDPAADPEFRTLATIEELDWVMKEAMRLHTPILYVPRRTIEPFAIGGFEIPAGIQVAVAPGHTHRMTEYWTEPDRFDPERFSPARAEHKRVPGSFLPFGAGAHACLGQVFAEIQVRLILLHVLREFGWEVPRGYRARYQQVPIQAPKDGLPIGLEPRALRTGPCRA